MFLKRLVSMVRVICTNLAYLFRHTLTLTLVTELLYGNLKAGVVGKTDFTGFFMRSNRAGVHHAFIKLTKVTTKKLHG